MEAAGGQAGLTIQPVTAAQVEAGCDTVTVACHRHGAALLRPLAFCCLHLQHRMAGKARGELQQQAGHRGQCVANTPLGLEFAPGGVGLQASAQLAVMRGGGGNLRRVVAAVTRDAHVERELELRRGHEGGIGTNLLARQHARVARALLHADAAGAGQQVVLQRLLRLIAVALRAALRQLKTQRGRLIA